MQKALTFLLFTSVILFACSRDNDNLPKPQADPLLKYSITRTGTRITRITHYNDKGSFSFDTLFDVNGTAGITYEAICNAKGKVTRLDHYIPIIYTAGYYWRYTYEYNNDTIPFVSYRFFKGNQVARIAHIYNASGKLIMDSTYHTPNYGTFTYLTKYSYDNLGRLASSLDLDNNRDTTSSVTYVYSPLHTEKTTITITQITNSRDNKKNVIDYNGLGKISSEKDYDLDGQSPLLASQTYYTYNGLGQLTKKTTTPLGSPEIEEQYFYNSDGKIEKLEYYQNGQLGHVTTYYYE